MSRREAFLRGERPDDVALFFADAVVDDPAALAERGDRVEGGVILVLDGEQGRSAFASATGVDAMAFARRAMDREGTVASDLTDGTCPDDGETHSPEFVLAFAEEQHEGVGGIYEEGDVVHAYVHCSCGTDYSDRWLAGKR